MKKFLFLGILISSIMVTVYTVTTKQPSPSDILLMKNVEALTTGEGVYVPCAAEKHRSCSYRWVDASGNTGVNTWSGYVKV